MDRIEWITRFMRRMEQLDANLRPGQIAELAERCYRTDSAGEPEASAEVAGQGGVRRVD